MSELNLSKYSGPHGSVAASKRKCGTRICDSSSRVGALGPWAVERSDGHDDAFETSVVGAAKLCERLGHQLGTANVVLKQGEQVRPCIPAWLAPAARRICCDPAVAGQAEVTPDQIDIISKNE